MKPERSFVAERAVAQHCAALLPARQAGSADALARFAALGERLARALATGFAPLLGDCPPCVSAALPEEATPSALAVTIPSTASGKSAIQVADGQRLWIGWMQTRPNVK